MERRIAAILAADMVGYSRLMEADEEGTLARQKRHRLELVDPKIVAHGGTVIKLMGDGMIAEFPSVVEAVKCAVAIQSKMDSREGKEPERTRIRYRIAVNLGDLVFDDEDVFGDGVNIAARLEGLAEPGGILVSGMAYDHLKSNIPVEYEFLGEKKLKNISTPVRAYRVLMDSNSGSVGPATQIGSDQAPRPCIAVLPFDNFGPPDQSWFADGVVEDIITMLAHQPGLDVIARNSTFAFKGQAIDVSRVGSGLGAAYVLEGSIRRGGDRIRVTAQLIDVATGKHVWAERYDQSVEDIFSVMDEVTEKVCGAIIDPIQRLERSRAIANTSRDLSMRELYWQAWDHYCRMLPESFARSREIVDKGLDLVPDDSDLLTARTFLATTTVLLGWSADPAEEIALAQKHSMKAVKVAPQNAIAQFALSSASLLARDWETCLRSAEFAYELAPNHAAINFGLGNALLFGGGDKERAALAFDRAIRLSPRDAFSAMHHNCKSLALFLLGRNEEALEGWRVALSIQPDLVWARFNMVGVLARLGRTKDARRALDQALELRPDPDIEFFRSSWPFGKEADLQQIIDAQRLAGLKI